MSKFKIGSYVVSSYLGQGRIGRVYDVFRNTIGVEVNYPTGIRFTYEIAKRECSIALNLDYIHTLNAEQMTWFIEVKYPEIAKNGVPEIWFEEPYDGWEAK